MGQFVGGKKSVSWGVSVGDRQPEPLSLQKSNIPVGLRELHQESTFLPLVGTCTPPGPPLDCTSRVGRFPPIP